MDHNFIQLINQTIKHFSDLKNCVSASSNHDFPIISLTKLLTRWLFRYIINHLWTSSIVHRPLSYTIHNIINTNVISWSRLFAKLLGAQNPCQPFIGLVSHMINHVIEHIQLTPLPICWPSHLPALPTILANQHRLLMYYEFIWFYVFICYYNQPYWPYNHHFINNTTVFTCIHHFTTYVFTTQCSPLTLVNHVIPFAVPGNASVRAKWMNWSRRWLAWMRKVSLAPGKDTLWTLVWWILLVAGSMVVSLDWRPPKWFFNC